MKEFAIELKKYKAIKHTIFGGNKHSGVIIEKGDVFFVCEYVNSDNEEKVNVFFEKGSMFNNSNKDFYLKSDFEKYIGVFYTEV